MFPVAKVVAQAKRGFLFFPVTIATENDHAPKEGVMITALSMSFTSFWTASKYSRVILERNYKLGSFECARIDGGTGR